MQIMHKFVVCLRLLVAFLVLSSLEGCRSTRNTMSQVPGMGWMASKEPNVSDWDTEGVSPTKPAVGETPQVTSRTKSKSSTSTDPAKDVATSEFNYPDTGYPDPSPKSAQQASASKTEKYDTGKYGTSAKSEVAEASTGEAKNGAVAVPPKRGFYGSEYSEDRATTAANSSSERPTDESTADSRSYSRFSSGEVADENAEDSSLGETARQVAQDLKSGYRGAANEARDQLASGTRAIAATPQAMVEDAENTARQAYQKLGQKAVAAEEEIVSNYERATEEVKQAGDKVVQAAESSVKKAAETTDQTVASGVAATGAAVERTYSRFQNRFAESAEDLAEASNTSDASNSAHRTPADGAALNTSGAEPTVTTQPTKPAVPSSGVGRSTQPWRPGSTSTYSGDTKPIGNDANGNSSSSVEPASYRDTTRSRFSPTYR